MITAVQLVRVPSLCTRWLQRLEKWLPQPLVVTVIGSAVGGQYWCPGRPVQLGDHVVRGDRGVLVLDEEHSVEPSVLAHEWRHHWQWHRGWRFDHTPWHRVAGPDYRHRIVTFFQSSRTERDALRFELRQAPSEASLTWWDWMQGA